MAGAPFHGRSGLRFRLNPDTGVRKVLDAFSISPQSFVRGGTVYKPGSRGFAVMAEIAGRPCFIKHYRCQGWVYRLSYFLRPSRAARTFAVSRRLAARGFPVPAPLFYLEERRFRLLGESYLVTEFVPGCNLQAFWREAAAEERREVLRQCAAVLGRLHASGCCHGDLKWNNLLIREAGEGPQIVLADVDAATCRPWRGRRQIDSDLQRFLSDLDAADPSGEGRDFFVDEWQKWLRRS